MIVGCRRNFRAKSRYTRSTPERKMSLSREQDNIQTICPLSSWKRGQALSDFIFLDYGNINTTTWLASRTLFRQFPFDVHLAQCEDYDLLLRMEAAGVDFVWC